MIIKDLDENYELDELNLGLTRKGRDIKRSNKAAKTSIGDEARQMEVELVVWMKNSGIKKITVDDLQNYFGQKGLGDTARKVLTAMPAKAEKKSTQQAAAQASAGLGQPAAAASPSPQFKSSRNPPVVNKNFDKSQKLSDFGKVGNEGTARSDAGILEAQGESTLTRREVKTAIKLVIQNAYRAQAGFGQSRFAQKNK
jgi:hypothetical protein